MDDNNKVKSPYRKYETMKGLEDVIASKISEKEAPR